MDGFVGLRSHDSLVCAKSSSHDTPYHWDGASRGEEHERRRARIELNLNGFSILSWLWQVAGMCMFTCAMALGLCFVYNPIRKEVREMGKKTLIYYIFHDCDGASVCFAFAFDVYKSRHPVVCYVQRSGQ